MNQQTADPPGSLEDLADSAARGHFGDHVSTATVDLGFVTAQGVRHSSRAHGYRNHVLSLRVADAVGSCAVEPGEVTEDVVFDCLGAPVRELLAHPCRAVRVATLDAYLQWLRPHHEHAEPIVIGRGDSLRKSLERAETVVDLLPVGEGKRVLVIGVVNSLLHHLRERGSSYVACDYRGGKTEWGETVVTDAGSVLDDCDAVLASGMVVGNGTFAPLLEHARTSGVPFVLFAQTASGILPRFLGSGVTAISAEPYPFFWLDGGPSSIYHYRTRVDANPRRAGKEGH
ncbi:Rossmann-like domain-containing protein [Parasphingorhabdus pacifica]